jgi:hypothetical protein
MLDTKKKIEQLINEAQPETRKIIGEIFALEKDKLYMSIPHGIVEDIVEKIKDIVQ